MDRVETRYVKSGEVNVAYQVVGGGEFDLTLDFSKLVSMFSIWVQP